MSALPKDDQWIGFGLADDAPPAKVKAEDAQVLIDTALTTEPEEPTVQTAPTPTPRPPAPKLQTEVLATAVENAKRTTETLLPRFWLPVRSMLAMTAALRLRDLDLCIATVLAGPSGVGKGVNFKIFDGGTGVVRVDSITPTCFVTGHADTQGLATAKDKDILPKIQNQLMMTKDSSTIFGQNSDQLKKLFSVLVPVLDGDGYAPAFGTHGIRAVTGSYRFAWAIGSLPFKSQTWDAHVRFGSRLGFYNLFKPAGLSDEEVLAERDGAPLTEKVAECRKAVHVVLDRIFAILDTGMLAPKGTQATETVVWGNDPKDLTLWLVKFSRFLSAARKSRAAGNIPDPEREEEDEADPQRAISYLQAVARGSAMLDDRTEINDEDMALAVHYTLSGSKFGRVLTALAHHPNGLTVKTCADLNGWSTQTATNRMHAAVEQELVQWANAPKVAASGRGRPVGTILVPAANWSWLGDLKAMGWLAHSELMLRTK